MSERSEDNPSVSAIVIEASGCQFSVVGVQLSVIGYLYSAVN
jgi:hypothetical protein